MVVNDEFGVMQRVMGVFTRKRINVDTIVVGRCEIAGKSRIMLTVKDRAAADIAVADLLRLHDVVHAETVDDLKASPQYVVGTPDEVLARLRDVPGQGGITFNPLAGGLPSHLAWPSLELFAAKVLPRLRSSSPTPAN